MEGSLTENIIKDFLSNNVIRDGKFQNIKGVDDIINKRQFIINHCIDIENIDQESMLILLKKHSELKEFLEYYEHFHEYLKQYIGTSGTMEDENNKKFYIAFLSQILRQSNVILKDRNLTNSQKLISLRKLRIIPIKFEEENYRGHKSVLNSRLSKHIESYVEKYNIKHYKDGELNNILVKEIIDGMILSLRNAKKTKR